MHKKLNNNKNVPTNKIDNNKMYYLTQVVNLKMHLTETDREGSCYGIALRVDCHVIANLLSPGFKWSKAY